MQNYQMSKKHEQDFSNHYSSTTITDASNPSPNPSYNYGLTPTEALTKYADELTMYEKTELSQYDVVYTIGSYRRETLYEIADHEGYYKVKVGEQLGYRY
jgi:hypothetical protein